MRRQEGKQSEPDSDAPAQLVLHGLLLLLVSFSWLVWIAVSWLVWIVAFPLERPGEGPWARPFPVISFSSDVSPPP